MRKKSCYQQTGVVISELSCYQRTVEFVKIVNRSTDILKSASSNISSLKSDQIENQKLMLELKDRIIQKKDNHVHEVQKVVKTEVNSFSDIVKQNNPQIPGKTLQAAVKSAVENEKRSCCVMVYGIWYTDSGGSENPS
jgi:hypothetical protein